MSDDGRYDGLQQQSDAKVSRNLKKKNNDFRLETTDAAAGNLEIDYVIRGNELEAEHLWMEIVRVLEQHEEEYGGESRV